MSGSLDARAGRGVAARVVMIIAVGVALGGCVGAPPNTPGPGEGAAPPMLSPPVPSLPPLPIDPTQRTYKLEECFTLVGGFDMPAEFARGWIPTGFEAFALAPGTVSIHVVGDSCTRATIGQQVMEGFRRVQFSLRVEPTNDSWLPEVAPARYLLDSFVSSQAAAAHLTALGLQGTAADIAVEQAAGADANIVSWTISAAGGSIEFSYPTRGESTVDTSQVVNYFYAGPDPYVRVKEQSTTITGAWTGNSGGPLLLDGLGNISALARVPTYTLRVNPDVLATTSAHVELAFFQAERAE